MQSHLTHWSSLIMTLYIVACHLPRGSELWWCEDMGGGLPNAPGPRAGLSLQPTGLQTIKLSTNNTQCIRLINTDWYKNLTRVGRDNIRDHGPLVFAAYLGLYVLVPWTMDTPHHHHLRNDWMRGPCLLLLPPFRRARYPSLSPSDASYDVAAHPCQDLTEIHEIFRKKSLLINL